MAAADFRFDIRTPLGARSHGHQIGSPQVRLASFLPVHRIYVSDSCMSIGHWVTWPPPPSEPPHIRFLFVEHAFCYRLPPDLVLPLRPCRVANSSPHRASSGFAPYRSAPCWAHQRRSEPMFRPDLQINAEIRQKLILVVLFLMAVSVTVPIVTWRPMFPTMIFKVSWAAVFSRRRG